MTKEFHRFLVFVFLLAPSWAGAAAITVNTENDVISNDGLCSLREAIIAANTNAASGAAAGECAAGSGADAITLRAGTYTLSLVGAGENASATGDLDVTEELTINSDGAATTMIDGNGTDRVFHLGPVGLGSFAVTMSAITIQNGNPGGDEDGGAVHNRLADLTLTDSILRDNTAGTTGDGGAVYNDAGMMHCLNTTISGNTGEFGGGVSHSVPGDYSNCTISGNNAMDGGGIYVAGNAPDVVTILNSTITDNTATVAGGGLEDEVVLGGTTSIKNSIIAGNTPTNCEGTTIASQGNNLDSANSCGFAGAGDLINADPLLGELADNAGPTPTHALGGGSPAIDAGDNAACEPDDQRGVARPVDGDGDGNAVCDIGAFEATTCGDGTLQEPAEECDDGNDVDTDTCRNDCTSAVDTDGDGLNDASDNCPDHANADQADADGDGTGDACESSNGAGSGCSLIRR